MEITSDELNFLIYRYLQESGFIHSAFVFGYESHSSDWNTKGDLVPAGALINIIQKGVFYTQVEIRIREDGTEHDISEKLSLIDAVIPFSYLNTSQQRQDVVIKDEDSEFLDVNSSQTLIQSNNVDASLVKCTILNGHESEVFICSWCPTTDILASGSGDGTARLWDLTDHEFNRPPLTLSHYVKKNGSEVSCNKDVTAIDWKSDGKLLATGSYDGYARIWHRDGRLSRSLGQHNGPIFAMKWNKNANYIISVGMDQTTCIWDIACSKYNKKLNCHKSAVLDIDWKTSNCFATCGVDALIHVYHLDHDQPIKTFKGHTNEINIITWDPQGNLLASCSDDTTVKLWCMNQDMFVHDFRAHTKEIYTMQWSPTGPGTNNPNMNLKLASGSYDKTIRLWDVERGVLTDLLAKHTDAIYSVAFSPDGQFLASGSFDKYMYVWSTKTGQLVYSFKTTAGIYDISWNHTSEKLSASSADGKLHVYDLRKP